MTMVETGRATATAKERAPSITALSRTSGAAAPRRVSKAHPDAGKILKAVLARLDDSKAEDIVTIDLRDKSTIADTMVIASGRSNRHVGAMADNIAEDLSKVGMKGLRVQGMPLCDWVVIDAGDVVVHLFRPEVRSFYNLEKMWAAQGGPARAI